MRGERKELCPHLEEEALEDERVFERRVGLVVFVLGEPQRHGAVNAVELLHHQHVHQSRHEEPGPVGVKGRAGRGQGGHGGNVYLFW